MKKNRNFLVWSLLLPVVLAFLAAGCGQMLDSTPGLSAPVDPVPEIFDDPDLGIMTKETADKVFKWVSNSGKIMIQLFKSAGALENYLKGSDRAVAADPTRLFIKTIDDKPVNKIDAGAFSPSPDGSAADISSVVSTLRLSDAVTVINKTAFKGIQAPEFLLEIPHSVLTVLTQDTLNEISQNITVKTPAGEEEPEDPGFEKDITIEYIDINIKEGIIPVIGGTPVTKIETAEYTGTVSWSSAPVTFAARTFYSAAIYLTPKTGFTLTGVRENFFKVKGAETTNSANSGIITAVFPKTAIPVDDLAELSSAINSIEQDDIIQLRPPFYEKVNLAGEPITIHAAAVDNTIPYTIQGPPDAEKHPAPALTVGILIANDNITLKDIKIEITNSGRAVGNAVDNIDISNKYCSAITIARAGANGGFLEREALTSRNVTVDKCDIVFDASNQAPAPKRFTAGIYVAYGKDGKKPPYLPHNVAIQHSSVKATGHSTSAVQALYIPPTVRVTNNKLTACGGDGSDTAPACAIFIEGVLASSSDQTIASMTDNTLHGKTFDFWIATPSSLKDDGTTQDPAFVNNDLNGTGGTINMAALGFGTGDEDKDKIWASKASANANNNYYKLLQDLKIQCDEKGRVGYGRIFIAMVLDDTSVAGIEEKYEIKNGQITAIDYLGYPADEDEDGGYNVTQTAEKGRIGGDGEYHTNRDTVES
jgi:hypothetical protein